eukprot:m.37960 g.37960  ORF g.37960 m.37960 type:complete len:61 (-) comp10143_c0_seq3:3740-3922(-)
MGFIEWFGWHSLLSPLLIKQHGHVVVDLFWASDFSVDEGVELKWKAERDGGVHLELFQQT